MPRMVCGTAVDSIDNYISTRTYIEGISERGQSLQIQVEHIYVYGPNQIHLLIYIQKRKKGMS